MPSEAVAPEVRESPENPNRCRMTNNPSDRALALRSSSTSKLKHPDLHEKRLSGSVPSFSSWTSLKPSPSSSSSALLPIPSESVSNASLSSLGKRSALLPTPSESSSADSLESSGKTSRLSPTPSPSPSNCSAGSKGNASALSANPSESESAFRPDR